MLPELDSLADDMTAAILRKVPEYGQADDDSYARGVRQVARLAETLLAWLESADNAGAAARRLHVHPQTVRYRVRQLTELFGDRLCDPEARFTLQVALRIRRLVSAARPS
jgi:sugar diacid utilization regulator